MHARLADSLYFTHPLAAVILLVLGGLWWWMQRDMNRDEIRRVARRWNARALHIRWLPCHTLNENETAYEVTLQLASGKRLKAVCRCSPDDDLVWEGAPWWAHDQPPTPPSATPTPSAPADAQRIVADCPRCGHGLRQATPACPNCGTERDAG